MTDARDMAALLRWYVAMGVDEAIDETSRNRLAETAAAPPRRALNPNAAVPPRAAPPPAIEPQSGAAAARKLAAEAASLDELQAIVAGFEGCALRRMATNTVFADGTPHAPVMVIGEAPGADEDRVGKPFVGRSGQLLDRMLAAIGLDRPEVVMLCGGTATSAMLGRREGITRLRGRWFDLAVPELDHPVPALTTYHPSFLLRSPARKSESWRDFLELQSKLDALVKK